MAWTCRLFSASLVWLPPFSRLLWATGGWTARRRRSIQQELDLANGLPESSPARTRLTTHVEDEIEIYLYRISEQQPQTIARALAPVGLGVVILVPTTIVLRDASMVTMVVFEGLFGVLFFWSYALILRSLWIRWSRRHHGDLLKQARNERAGQVADTPAAAEGQQVELA